MFILFRVVLIFGHLKAGHSYSRSSSYCYLVINKSCDLINKMK